MRKKETVAEKATRLQWEVDMLRMAIIAMTNGLFWWGDWKDASIIISDTLKIGRSERYGVARAPKHPHPIILKETRAEVIGSDGQAVDHRNSLQVLSVDELMHQPAFNVLDSNLELLTTIVRDAVKSTDVEDDTGVWSYEWPKMIGGAV